MQLNMEEPTAAHRQLLAALYVAGEDVRLTLRATAAARGLLDDGAFVEGRDLGDLRELLRNVPRQGLGVLCALPARLIRADSRIGARFAAARLTRWDARTDRGARFDGEVELLAAAPHHADVLVRFQLGYEPGADREARVALHLHGVERAEES